MTSIVCETATLADAIMKAARVAPNKGAAFDKASGILMEVRPSRPSPLYVKSTDLEVTYLQRVSVLSSEGDDVNWRIPSQLVSGIMSSLPLGSGQQVTMRDEGNDVIIESGSSVAHLRTYAAEYFPTITPFTPADMAEVEDLPRRLAQVAWATDPAASVLAGVNIDGTFLSGCDRYVLAQVPCVVPVNRPITVPLSAVAGLLKNVGSVALRATDDRLQLMPDEDTQIACTILREEYPKVNGIKRDQFGCEFTAPRERVVDVLNRMMVLGRGERYMFLNVSVGAGEIALAMTVEDTGHMQDAITVAGGIGPDDEPYEFTVAPDKLSHALNASARADIKFRCGPNASTVFQVTDDAGLEVWISPIHASTYAGAKKAA